MQVSTTSHHTMESKVLKVSFNPWFELLMFRRVYLTSRYIEFLSPRLIGDRIQTGSCMEYRVELPGWGDKEEDVQAHHWYIV